MKARIWTLLTILAVLVIVSATACGSEEALPSTEAAVATAAVTAVVTSTPQPTEEVVAATSTPLAEPTAVAEPTALPEPTIDLAAVASVKLDSYRAATTMTVSGTRDGKQIDESIQVTTEFVRDPIAQHSTVTLTSSEQPTQSGTIDVYQVEGMQYTYYGDQWLSSPLTDTSSIESDTLFSAADVLDDSCGWEDKGRETLDGIRVQHWVLAETAAQECFASLDVQDAGQITVASGDMYVAVEGAYVAKMDLRFEGTELGLMSGSSEVALDEGRMVISFSMTDVNQSIAIEVPEAALEASALPEDIPIYPDAEGASQMFGMITYTTVATAEQVKEWYLTEMPNYGWTAGEVSEFGGMYTFSFTKEGKKADLMIGPAGATTSVLITVGVEE